jgi:hypothetical protein
LAKQKKNLTYQSATSTIFSTIDSDLAVKSLQEDGYCLDIKLTSQIIQEILDFAYSTPIQVDSHPEIKFIYSEKNKAEAEYKKEIITGKYVNTGSRCPALKQLENDPKLLEIAAKYLGSTPICIRSHLGWSFVAQTQAYEKLGKVGIPMTLFHCDLDDYRALKFFFFLTDTDESSGAHLCIRGSHKKRNWRHYLFRSDSAQSIINYYGNENLVNIYGKAGFGFAEDPFCFHRGTPPVNNPRLMLQLEFALNDYKIWPS